MRMKNYFWTLIFALFFSAYGHSQCCTYTLTMYDSYGDGWNGTSNIDIYVNGVAVITDASVPDCACTSNNQSSVTFTACTGDILTWNYANTGTYLNENSFAIMDEVGNAIASSGPPITPGTNPGGTFVCPETCNDGIQNQDETGVDCGGTFCLPCHCSNGVMDAGLGEVAIDYGGPCGDCSDGIQNGPETGIDCGGPFCLPCNTNSTSTPSTQCCSNTAQATVYPTTCDQIGTSAYNLNSPIVNFTTVGNANCPPAGSSGGCGTFNDNGQWIHLDLAPGVDYLQANFQGGSVSTGNHNVFASLFQGPNCSSLTQVPNCQDFFFFTAGAYAVVEVSWSNLDPNQDVWIYLWDTADNKEDIFDIQFVGAAMNTNTSCPGSTAIGDACNLGAQGASFTTPGAAGVSCSGGNWGSNENTTFYSFTADQTTGSLEIENIICNDGTNGVAQFAVWTSCANIGTYGAGSGFLGCAVGTATISLSPLVPGQTYYIAADGFAGDNCTWGFTGTGIILPIELAELAASYNGKNVVVEWSTASEQNNDYFTIQRTHDGRDFEDIGKVSGAGNSSTLQQYSFNDPFPYRGTSYYRIKQTDYNGEFEYSNVVSVSIDDSRASVVRTINLMGQDVNKQYKGVVIDIYSDGTSSKRIQ